MYTINVRKTAAKVKNMCLLTGKLTALKMTGLMLYVLQFRRTQHLSLFIISSEDFPNTQHSEKITAAFASPYEPLSFKGYLKTRNDTNTFAFALDSVYAVNITFTTSARNTGYYRLSVHDSAGTVLTQNMIAGEKLYSDTGRLYLGAGKYIIKVEQGYSWSGMPYTLNVNTSYAENTESEPNNSPQTANMIPVNESINASTGTRDDIDYFVFTLAKPSLVKPSLDFNPVRLKEGIYRLKLYALEILNVDKDAFIFRGDNMPSRKIKPFILEAGTYITAISRTESEKIELGLHEYTLRVEPQDF